jgi:hypothetical protein
MDAKVLTFYRTQTPAIPHFNSSPPMLVSPQVSVWGRGRLGADAFLGEVVIPLREVGAAAAGGAAPQPRAFTLGRRSAREKARPMGPERRPAHGRPAACAGGSVSGGRPA